MAVGYYLYVVPLDMSYMSRLLDVLRGGDMSQLLDASGGDGGGWAGGSLCAIEFKKMIISFFKKETQKRIKAHLGLNDSQ